MKPTGPFEPTEPTRPTEPTEPTGPTEPTEPTRRYAVGGTPRGLTITLGKPPEVKTRILEQIIQYYYEYYIIDSISIDFTPAGEAGAKTYCYNNNINNRGLYPLLS